jgi:retron-type reverse transcriptase
MGSALHLSVAHSPNADAGTIVAREKGTPQGSPISPLLANLTRPGNPYLKGALGVAALSASRSKNAYLATKFRASPHGGGR